MKISQFHYKVNELITIELNKNLSYPITNIRALAHFVNYRTYKINGLYQSLLFSKISNLKAIKNHLLMVNHAYKTATETTKQTILYKQHEVLKSLFPREYKQFIDMGFIKPITALETDILRNTAIQINYIHGIEYTIKYLEKQINHYQKEQQNKTLFESYKVSEYDLLQLDNHILTDNIKKLVYYYLVKLKRTTISKRAYNYLNDENIKGILTDYQEKAIYQDFDIMLVNELNHFTEWFINRTL